MRQLTALIIVAVTAASACAEERVTIQSEPGAIHLGGVQGKFSISQEFAVSQDRNGSKVYAVYKDPSTRFTTRDGFVFMTGIQGAWNGGAESGKAVVDRHGNWSIVISSGGSPITMKFRALSFPANRSVATRP